MKKVILLAASPLLLVHCDTPKTEQRPNIIVILSDDMGYSDIGCFGGEIHTPNLDALAGNGLRFTQFYNTSRCCPTRASLLTGLYSHQAGIGEMVNDRGTAGYRGDLNQECMTIAEAMKTSGYSTYMAGKWHVTPYKPKNYSQVNWPLQRGFDRFYGMISGAGSYYDPISLTRDNQYISPLNDPEYTPETYYFTDAISDHATRYIREHDADNPFFLYVAYTAAHWPMHALEKDIEKYKGKYDVGYEAIRAARAKKMKELGIFPDAWEMSPLAGKSWSEVENKAWEARCMEVYAAMIDNMDQGIGRILAELKRKGELDNTIIMFLQDNGGCHEGYGRKEREPIADTLGPDDFQTRMIPNVTRNNDPIMMGQDVMPGGPESYIAYGLEWANVSNTPFRLFKTYSHEGGISTPLIVHWPAGIKEKNGWRKTPGHLVDIMATCVDLGKATYPDEYKGVKLIPLEGMSLRPVFDKDELPNRMLFFEHERSRAVRADKWKLVAQGADGPWELYDLEADRTEMSNLVDNYPDKARELADAWEAWAIRARVKPYPESIKNPR
jgi:arylsulfatase A-like enzyme